MKGSVDLGTTAKVCTAAAHAECFDFPCEIRFQDLTHCSYITAVKAKFMNICVVFLYDFFLNFYTYLLIVLDRGNSSVSELSRWEVNCAASVVD